MLGTEQEKVQRIWCLWGEQMEGDDDDEKKKDVSATRNVEAHYFHLYILKG